MLVIIEPGAYIGEREKEPSARAKRIVMSFSLERWADQIRRDDVQMKVSFKSEKEGGWGLVLVGYWLLVTGTYSIEGMA